MLIKHCIDTHTPPVLAACARHFGDGTVGAYRYNVSTECDKHDALPREPIQLQ
jgi:hypothetical protein